MRLTPKFGTAVLAVAALGIIGDRLGAQDLNAEAWRMETKGQATEARQHLQKAAAERPKDAAALEGLRGISGPASRSGRTASVSEAPPSS